MDLATIGATTGFPLVDIFNHMRTLLQCYGVPPSYQFVATYPDTHTVADFIRFYGQDDGWYQLSYPHSTKVFYTGVQAGAPKIRLRYCNNFLVTVEEYESPALNHAPSPSLVWNDQFYPLWNHYSFNADGHHFTTYDYRPIQYEAVYGVSFTDNYVALEDWDYCSGKFPWDGKVV